MPFIGLNLKYFGEDSVELKPAFKVISWIGIPLFSIGTMVAFFYGISLLGCLLGILSSTPEPHHDESIPLYLRVLLMFLSIGIWFAIDSLGNYLGLPVADAYIIRLEDWHASGRSIIVIEKDHRIDAILRANGYLRGGRAISFGYSSSVDDGYMTALVLETAKSKGQSLDEAKSKIHNISGAVSGKLAALFYNK
jgi:hypothetical protein